MKHSETTATLVVVVFFIFDLGYFLGKEWALLIALFKRSALAFGSMIFFVACA